MSEQARKVAKQICARWFSTDTDSTWARQAIDDIADALAQARREEREACAKVADKKAKYYKATQGQGCTHDWVANDIA